MHMIFEEGTNIHVSMTFLENWRIIITKTLSLSWTVSKSAAVMWNSLIFYLLNQ